MAGGVEEAVDEDESSEAAGEEEEEAGPVVVDAACEISVEVFCNDDDGGDAKAVGDDGEGDGAGE